MVQRYKFESKSQHQCVWGFSLSCCFQWFKDTNLKANHNRGVWNTLPQPAVSNGSKIQIWKQITTARAAGYVVRGLFPMVQRYKFESKSQHVTCIGYILNCCFQWFKDTNLKANHNKLFVIMLVQKAVSNGSKIQIWKQITTKSLHSLRFSKLFPMVQRYKFESKSQQ